MINSIIESIAVALNSEFGSEYTVYTESIEQGLKEPCFFVLCINTVSRIFFDKRYFKGNQFCIQYFPADKQRKREECSMVAERLFSCLEYVLNGSDLIRGTKMNAEIVDGILNFFVNYDLFVMKPTETTPMEEYSQNIGAKG